MYSQNNLFTYWGDSSFPRWEEEEEEEDTALPTIPLVPTESRHRIRAWMNLWNEKGRRKTEITAI